MTAPQQGAPGQTPDRLNPTLALRAEPRQGGRVTLRALLAASAVLILTGCSTPTQRRADPPPPSPTASPTPEPSRTPPPPEWAGDPDGKAACDTVRALYEAGPMAADRSNPGVDALAVAAQRGMKSTLARIAGASVDLNATVRAARDSGGGAADVGMVSAAYTLGKVCHEERYYKPEPWPPVSSGP